MEQHLEVLIVDDEMQSRLLIRKLLEGYPAITRVWEAGTIAEARHLLSTVSPGLVFLDIQMRNESGFELLEGPDEVNFGVIFTTAHSEYAVRAFRFSAIDYLIKPIDVIEFGEAMTRVLALPQLVKRKSGRRIEQLKNHLKSGQSLPNKLTIPTTEGFMFLEAKDIIYCRADSNYTEFFLAGKQKVVSSYTLGYYQDLLSGHAFFRAHRSYLINLAHIKMYRRGEGGTVVMADGMEIEISRGNKEAFLKLFKG